MSDSPIKVQLVRDIANIKVALATNDFDGERQRAQARTLLVDIENQLETLPPQTLPQAGRLRFEVAPEEVPGCFTNGNLDQCFLSKRHSINIAGGTGDVFQLSGMLGSHSAVVAYTLASDPTPHQVSVNASGLSGVGYTMFKTFTWTQPDCNVSAQTVTSTATHQVSIGLTAVGSLSGVATSPGGDSCPFQGLTVTLGSSTIPHNGVTEVTVSGMTQCPLAGVSSSNTNVATILDAGNGFYQAQAGGPGTVSIEATCGTQRGSATLTVGQPPCNSGSSDSTVIYAQLSGVPSSIAGRRARAVSTEGVVGIPLHGAFACGDPSAPGSGGGDPPSSGGGEWGCKWYRDYVIYTDGTWAWLTQWYQECNGGASLVASSNGGKFLVASSNAPTVLPPMRVRLQGMGRLSSGTAVGLEQDPAGKVDVVLSVDTTRASAADVALALERVESFLKIRTPTVGKSGARGEIMPAQPAAAASRYNENSHVRSVLRDLLKSSEQGTTRSGRGRVMEISVERGGSKTKWSDPKPSHP